MKSYHSTTVEKAAIASDARGNSRAPTVEPSISFMRTVVTDLTGYVADYQPRGVSHFHSRLSGQPLRIRVNNIDTQIA